MKDGDPMPHSNPFDRTAMEPAYDMQGRQDGYMVHTPRGPDRIRFADIGAGLEDTSDDVRQRIWDAAYKRSDAFDDPERMLDLNDISEESMEALYGGRNIVGFRVFTPGGPLNVDMTEEEQRIYGSEEDEDAAEQVMRDVKKRGYGALIEGSPRMKEMISSDSRMAGDLDEAVRAYNASKISDRNIGMDKSPWNIVGCPARAQLSSQGRTRTDEVLIHEATNDRNR